MKLPVLVQHFKEHRQLDGSLSLIGFLSMHYWGKHVDDNDQQRDNQLPFKEFHKEILQPFSTPVKIVVLKPVVYFLKSDFPLTGAAFLPDPKLSTLFRPPRA